MSPRARSILAVSVLVVLLGTAWWRLSLDDSFDPIDAWPGQPPGARNEPLATIPDPGAGDGTVAFISTQSDGSPVTYDPCVPLRIFVNEREAFAGSREFLDGAIASIRATTGLDLVVEGTTTHVPSDDDEFTDDDGNWAPIVVAWSDPETSPDLEGDVAGLAGSVEAPLDDWSWFVTGSVVLDGPQLDEIRRVSPDGAQEVQGIIMHELGHLVGLDHVDDPGELMHPFESTDDHGWGPGDLSGLARLGAGRCVEY